MQQMYYHFHELEDIFKNNLINAFIVYESFIKDDSLLRDIRNLAHTVVEFSEFTPNPKYEEVKKGVSLFCKSSCNMIISIGGGSAIDVAKLIKAFHNMEENSIYINQEIVDSDDILHIAIPTTAGTGSEATQFAVVYYEGEKKSISHPSLIPSHVLLLPSLLNTLPMYQKKSAMLDAMGQAIESLWSVNSTEESRVYAEHALRLILENMDDYLKNKKECYLKMLIAANESGKAINISKTTAAHAMSYKLASLYGISHGHAVMLCLNEVWPYMVNHLDLCIDDRGEAHLNQILNDIDEIFGTKTHLESIGKMKQIYQNMHLDNPILQSKDELEILTNSVNLERLGNMPISLSKNALFDMYCAILKKEE